MWTADIKLKARLCEPIYLGNLKEALATTAW